VHASSSTILPAKKYGGSQRRAKGAQFQIAAPWNAVFDHPAVRNVDMSFCEIRTW
jgi:hypothetical protein